MKKSLRTLLLGTLLLGACSPGISATPIDIAAAPTLTPFSAAVESATLNGSSIPKIIVTVATPNIGQPPDGYVPTTSAESAIHNSPSIPKIIVTVGTPNIGQPPDGYVPTASVLQQACGYAWAYQDIPELTAKFDQAVGDLNPKAVSRANAFGENCLAADGHVVRFLAMETDFYVTLPVTALDDYKFFGDWVAQVMQVVNAMPNDLPMGPNSGFVEFRFEKSSAENLALRVSIQQFNQSAAGKMGEELFHMFTLQP